MTFDSMDFKDFRLILGMKGIDEECAHLQMVRAHLCVKRKTLTANEQSEAAEAAAYRNYAFQYAYAA